MSEKLTDEEFVRQSRETLRIAQSGTDEHGLPVAPIRTLGTMLLPEALDRIERLLSANAELLEADSVRQSWCDSNWDFMTEDDKERMLEELRTGKRRER